MLTFAPAWIFLITEIMCQEVSSRKESVRKGELGDLGD